MPEFLFFIIQVVAGWIIGYWICSILWKDSKPIKRGCRNCLSVARLSGDYYCQHPANKTAHVKATDYCPYYREYAQPTEKQIISNYLNRCYQEKG